MKKQVIVIGGGIGGIAASIRLAQKGFSVKVIEANAYLGGKLSEIHHAGFRFDAGPSLFTLPELVDELFVLCNKNPRHYFNYTKLPEICRYFYESGLQLTATSDIDAFADEIASKTTTTASAVRDHLHMAKQMYELTDKLFLQSSLHKISSYLQPHAFKALFRLGSLDTNQTMHAHNHKKFSDPHITQLFDRYATYNGSNPYQAPATLNLIPHLEYNLGAYFPEGGMYAIVQSLAQLAREMGVEFHLDEKVIRIEHSHQQVSAVHTTQQAYPTKLVVSNIDATFTYTRLLKDIKIPVRLNKQERSSSALVFYWGIQGSFPRLGLHNIFFSHDYEQEFKHLFGGKKPFNDPTIYLNISSKQQPNDAPIGHENWFTMINVPSNNGQEWDEIAQESKEHILQKLEHHLGTSIRDKICCETILDPIVLENKTGAAQGALYGHSSNDRFAAFLRHPNFHSTLKGLYFCGGTVHPGGGIPLCLFSAKIATNLIN